MKHANDLKRMSCWWAAAAVIAGLNDASPVTISGFLIMFAIFFAAGKIVQAIKEPS